MVFLWCGVLGILHHGHHIDGEFGAKFDWLLLRQFAEVNQPPSRSALVTRLQREHHAAGVRSSDGWTSDPQPMHRQITGDCRWDSDTYPPFIRVKNLLADVTHRGDGALAAA